MAQYMLTIHNAWSGKEYREFDSLDSAIRAFNDNRGNLAVMAMTLQNTLRGTIIATFNASERY